MIYCVEDERNIRELIVYTLESSGFTARGLESGKELNAAIAEQLPDLILLDIMLPEIDGFQILKQIRQKYTFPVIMLTAKTEYMDKITGLTLGADDYIVKPFSAREVVARVKAVLRRLAMAKEQPQQVLRFDDLEININNYDVRVKGERVPFTPKEVEIFQLLASHPGKVYERETILSLVWGYDFYGDTRAVDTQIKRIRQKLPAEGTVNWSIKTVYGVGYKFEVSR